MCSPTCKRTGFPISSGIAWRQRGWNQIPEAQTTPLQSVLHSKIQKIPKFLQCFFEPNTILNASYLGIHLAVGARNIQSSLTNIPKSSLLQFPYLCQLNDIVRFSVLHALKMLFKQYWVRYSRMAHYQFIGYYINWQPVYCSTTQPPFQLWYTSINFTAVWLGFF